MSGMHNSVDRWFLFDGNRLGLSVDGYKTLDDVIASAVRRCMVADDSSERKNQLRTVVEVALKHMDDDVDPEIEEDNDDCRQKGGY